MAGIVAAGAIGAALTVGGVAYAAGDPNSGNGEQIVRVVDTEDGTAGYDCPDKGGAENGGAESGENGTGDNL